MNWRGYTTPWDRLFACLVYLLPLIEAYLRYSAPLLTQLPELNLLFLPLQPFIFVYVLIVGFFSFGGISLGALLIFIALIALVVRNERIRHFVRFNTMQSIMIGIGLSIIAILWQILATAIPPLSSGLLQETIFNVLFLATVIAVVFSIVQSIRGLYAEIPAISDAVYMQVP